MPAAGSSYAGATLLNTGEVGTFDGTVYPQVFYMTPSVTGSYHFVVNKTSGPHGGYVDVYRLTEGSLGAFSYDTWVGWCGDDFTGGATTEESWVELVAGETYVIDCYDIEFDYHGTFTLEVDLAPGPSNDRVVNATLITAAQSGQWINGTTLESSEEEYEFDNILGNQMGSVWYKVVHGGPGIFIYGIRSTTPGWHPRITLFHGPGVNGAGTVNSTADLEFDISTEEVGDGTETPPSRTYDQSGPGTVGDLSPIEGGETFYLQVTGYENLEADYKGNFQIFATVTPPADCLDAEDYVNTGATVSVVSGAVRVTEKFSDSEQDPFESRYGDNPSALIIPGSAINSGSPGFYAVSVKTKNCLNEGGWTVGMIRNGQILHPGAIIDSTATSTPVLDWLTAPAGSSLTSTTDLSQSAKQYALNMVWYLPVKSDDTFEFIFVASTNSTRQIDITQVCFSRVKNAKESPAYDMIEIPDYPLGTTGADVADANPEQAGDLMIYKSVAPTYHEHDIDGHDICVTNDGVIWVLSTSRTLVTSSGSRIMGPWLMKWNPASPGWTIVNDDIEGLGVKRTGTSLRFDQYRVSMDTDGEDIWVCYGVDAGAFVGGGRNVNIRVKKYDVSADTWSNVGSPFCGPDHGGGGVLQGELSQEAGGFNECATIRVSPSGKPWVGFTDDSRTPGQGSTPITEGLHYYFLFAYIAEWTGSTWNIHRLLPPDYHTPSTTIVEAALGSSATASVVTEDGESCIRETATANVDDGVSIIPPAGRWMVSVRMQYNRVSGNGGIALKTYKNGTAITFTAQELSASSSTNPTWFWFGPNSTMGWEEFNGTTDTLEIRFWRTGTATEVFIDKIQLHEANAYIQQFDVNAAYVNDGQPQVALWMRQPSDGPGLSENPSAFVVWDINRPELDDTESAYYIPPGGQILNYAVTDFRNAYYEWNGSSFDLVWDKLTEEDVPDHVFLKTLEEPIASVPPYGHFQQGMGFCSGPFGNETDNYVALCLGGGQAFGFFGDAIIAVKVTDTGLEAFTPHSPTILGGAGYPQDFVLGLAGFSGWAWDIGGRSIHCDANGNIWLHWSMAGPEVDALDFVGTAYKHNDGDNGLGGWFAASEANEQMGWNPIEDASGRVVSSPNGDTIYLLQDTFIFDGWTIPGNVPGTYGVWECPVLPNHKIPLVPILGGAIDLTRIKFRAHMLGDDQSL